MMSELSLPTDPPAAKPRAPAASYEDIRRPEEANYEAVVRYYCRMRVGRVYPLVLGLRSLRTRRPPAAVPSGVVRVRVQFPGAIVSPADGEVVVGQADSVARFYVTPLARGSLPDARVELYQREHPIQQIGLHARAVSQILTWVLLVLAVIAPLAAQYLTSRVNLSRGAPPVPGRKEAPLEWVIKSSLPEVIKNRSEVASEVQDAYDIFQKMARADPWAVYVFCVFLGLAAVSWVTHSARRTTRRGKPLTL
jgi:hypothetical protein